MFDLSLLNLLLNATAAIILIGGAIYAALRVGSTNAGVEWKEEAAAIRARADRLHDDLQAALAREEKMQGHIIKLEALPDLNKLFEEMRRQREWGEKRNMESMKLVTEMFERHETRAAERHMGTISAFAKLNEGLTAINEGLRGFKLIEAEQHRRQNRDDVRHRGEDEGP